MVDWCHLLRLLVMLVGPVVLSHTPLLLAQDSNNVLGLPAVPQRPAAPVSAAGSAANKNAAVAKPSDAQIKAVLTGKITAASFYQDGLITLRVSTERSFIGSETRAQALQAARLIQRDVRLACGPLCKPADMPSPVLQADNTLSFEIVVEGYAGSLSNADMMNLVRGKRIKEAAQPAPALTPTSAASSP